jgi:spermidine synthase
MAASPQRMRAPEPSWIGVAVLGTFFVSGICGLVQEVAWTRLLRHVMGNTTFAITTVLCVFMGGLALGSYLGGRIVDRRADPLRVFALLEGTIGLYCFQLPWLIDAVEPLYRFLYQNTHTSFYVFSLIRFVFSGLLLIVPATFMGATLPVLSAFLVRSPDRIGGSVGRLYAINTFGAVAGASVTGFLLVPALGVSRTIYLGSCLNLLVCAVGFVLYARARGPRRTAPAAAGAPAAAPVHAPFGPGPLRALLVGYGLSGAAAMTFQIAWTRVLTLLIGSSVYAFSMIVTAFILGLASGAFVIARFVDRVRDPMRALAAIQIAIALSALLVVPVFESLPLYVTVMLARLGGSFWQLQLGEFALILLVTLVPTTLMGAAFPLASRMFAQGARGVGRSVGTIYAANTLGSILGSFAGGFVLIPWLGVQYTIVSAVTANLLIGCAFFGLASSLTPLRRATLAAGAAGVLVLALVLVPAWDVARMTLGPVIQARRLTEEKAQSIASLDDLAHRARVLFHEEDMTTTVTVKEFENGMRSVFVSGKPDASTGGDLPTQLLLAHVPLLLHPSPRSVTMIGLASGISLGSAGLHPLERLECVEISTAMVEASRFFDAHNHSIMDDPRVSIVVADGRNHLALTDRRYDVIMSAPSNPWIAGIADLFTREFYELARKRLAPHGIVSSFLESYNIDEHAFRSVVATFASVFPYMSVWNPREGDYLLIGSNEPLAIDYALLERRTADPAIAADLARIGIHGAADFLAHLVMGRAAALRFAEGAPVHTDDNALLEFSSPRFVVKNEGVVALIDAIEQSRELDLSFLHGTPDEGREALADATAKRVRAKQHVWQAILLRRRDLRDAAIGELAKAYALAPADPGVRTQVRGFLGLAIELVKRGAIDRGLEIFAELGPLVPDNERFDGDMGALLVELDELDAALAVYARRAAREPDEPTHLLRLGELSARRGRPAEAIAHFRRALALRSDFVPALNALAWLLASEPEGRLGDPAEAVRLAERANTITRHRSAALLDTLGVAYASAERFPEARATAQQAVAVAMASGDAAMADVLRSRLDLYAARKPYRGPPIP